MQYMAKFYSAAAAGEPVHQYPALGADPDEAMSRLPDAEKAKAWELGATIVKICDLTDRPVVMARLTGRLD